MPKTTITEAPVDAVADGGHFATMPKDISHVTFYFDATPDDETMQRRISGAEHVGT